MYNFSGFLQVKKVENKKVENYERVSCLTLLNYENIENRIKFT